MISSRMWSENAESLQNLFISFERFVGNFKFAVNFKAILSRKYSKNLNLIKTLLNVASLSVQMTYPQEIQTFSKFLDHIECETEKNLHV